MSQKIKVTITPDGTVKTEAVGYSDASCLSQEVQGIEALFGQLIGQEMKPEAALAPALATEAEQYEQSWM